MAAAIFGRGEGQAEFGSAGRAAENRFTVGLDWKQLGASAELRGRVHQVVALGHVEGDLAELGLHGGAEAAVVEESYVINVGEEAIDRRRADMTFNYGPHCCYCLLKNARK